MHAFGSPINPPLYVNRQKFTLVKKKFTIHEILTQIYNPKTNLNLNQDHIRKQRKTKLMPKKMHKKNFI
jgi:hypothetical protein